MSAQDSDVLRSSIERHLCGQGIDARLAHVFSELILNHVITWRVESASKADDCNAIIAFSFGYQLQPNGNRSPGPVNEALASVVLQHYRRRPRPVYAQSEVADALSQQIPSQDFHPIYPRISHKTGAVKYLSTEDMVAEVATTLRDPAAGGPWLLIAHRHHAVRCHTIAQSRGFGAMVTPELPDLYDHRSAQPWRRRHLAYLVSDVISRLTMYATNQIYPAMFSAAASSPRPQRQPAAAAEELDRPLVPATVPNSHDLLTPDDLNELDGDIPLLSSDQDYAAIPCLVPGAATATSTAQRNGRRMRGPVTDRTQEDTSRAAAAILKRGLGRSAVHSECDSEPRLRP